MAKPTVLVILDGWGLGDNNNPTGNAILLAKKLNYDYFLNNYPHTVLDSSGKR